MIAAGVEAVRRERRLLAALYLVQLFAALLFTAIAGLVLTSLYGRAPLFDRVMQGDLAALFQSLHEHGDAFAALGVTGVVLAAGYLVLSWYLTAGLTGRFAGRAFGEAAGAGFWSFCRLALFSAIPYAVAAGVLFGALAGLETFGVWLDLGGAIGRHLLWAAPGLLLLVLVSAAVDYARAELAATEGLGALRAFGRGWRRLAAAPPVLHVLLYWIAWLAVGGLYTLAAAPLTQALLLFALRQLSLILRFLLRAGLIAGQVARVTAPRARTG